MSSPTNDGLRFRWTPRRWARVIGISVLAGVLAGLAAAAVEFGLHVGVPLLVGRFTHVGGAQLFEPRLAILFLPMIGGLLSGLLVHKLCGDSSGGGTEAAVHAFHHESGRLSPRPLGFKAIANVIVIAFGGSVGPEGPIAGFSAALGSALAGALRLSPRERRIFLLAGCAGGVSAMFRCPLGGALFATTIPYREPENEDDALVPSVISAVAAYATFMAFWGHGHPLLSGTETLHFGGPAELLPYSALAVLCAGVGAFFWLAIRAAHRIPFRRLPPWVAPAVGGLGAGAIACVVPQVMDARYAFLQGALDGRLLTQHPWLPWFAIFGVVVLAKCIASAITVESGNVGGLLGPSVFVGGATGAALGAVIEAVAPGAFPEELRRALIPVGMAGSLAVTMRVPLAAAVMVSEITGTYGLVVPLMFVATLAYLIGRRFGLNHEQLSGPAESPAHAGREVLGVLEVARAGDVADRSPHRFAAPTATLGEVIARLEGDLEPVLVVDGGRRILGVIPRLTLVTASEDRRAEPVAACLEDPGRTLHEDDDLVVALEAFHDAPVDALPVVDRRGVALGLLRPAAVAEVIERWAREGRERFLREHGGLASVERDAQILLALSRLPPESRGRTRRRAVPPEVVGQSLRACDFRNRYGVAVVAIENGKTLFAPPDPERALQAQDVLVVVEADPAQGRARAPLAEGAGPGPT